jgi:phage terminase large subunit-like protein
MTSTSKPKPSPHFDKAVGYVEGVLDGTIAAGELIRLACERHQRDMARIADPDWPYRFDVELAERACKFVELFPHVKGRWAAHDELFRAEPWQCFWYCSLFGWVNKKTGKRRFRKGRCYVPRKNGKSLMVAPLGLYMLTADGEPGPEVFSGATNEKQAWEVFGPAKQMATKRKDFLERFGVQVNAKGLVVTGTMGKFEPVIGQPGDGSSPHCAITDEYHEHLTDAQLATMETGMGAREQPLSIVVSTAGDNIAGPCRDDWLECIKMLQGITANEELFALIYTCDKDDDWTSEIALRKANPNYGISVSAESLLSQQRDAINNPRKQGHFKTKHLNIWVQARDAFINLQRWAECARPELALEQFAGQTCYLGLDLASKVDLAAIEILFPPSGERVEFVRFGKYYLPRDTVELPENDHYRAWEIEGLLTVTEGNQTDYFQIFEDLKELTKRLEALGIAFDPHNATMLVTACQNEGLPMIEYGPTVLNFSEPMKQVEALILNRQLLHNGDKVCEWSMSNVVAKLDRKDNIYPNKEKPENKIDPFVALCMAMGLYLAGDGEVQDDWSGFLRKPVVA